MKKENTHLSGTRHPYTYLIEPYQQYHIDLCEKLGHDLEYETVAPTTFRSMLFVDTPQDRRDLYKRLIDEFGFEEDKSITGSGEGGVRKGKWEVVIKPQTNGGHGKENEVLALDLFNTPNITTIKFVDRDHEREMTFHNVKEAVDASADGARNYDKSDINLRGFENEHIIGISIKKDKSARLESSKSRWSHRYQRIIDKLVKGEILDITLKQHPDAKPGVMKMYDNTGSVVSRLIFPEMPASFQEGIIFGDTDPDNTIVVVQDFSDVKYEVVGNTLTIYVKALYWNILQVHADNQHPVPCICHHKGKKLGLELRCFPAASLEFTGGANVRYLDFNKL